MNYEFTKLDLDTYKLIYTDKEKKEVSIEFKRTNEMAKAIQGITAKARIKMYQQLSELGMNKDDLVIKKDDGKGHITYDETNYQEMEKKFTEEETIITVNELIVKCFKKNLMELFIDMGMDVNNVSPKDTKAIELFTQKFATIIKGEEEKTPCGTN